METGLREVGEDGLFKAWLPQERQLRGVEVVHSLWTTLSNIEENLVKEVRSVRDNKTLDSFSRSVLVSAIPSGELIVRLALRRAAKSYGIGRWTVVWWLQECHSWTGSRSDCYRSANVKGCR